MVYISFAIPCRDSNPAPFELQSKCQKLTLYTTRLLVPLATVSYNKTSDQSLNRSFGQILLKLLYVFVKIVIIRFARS